MPDPNKHAQLAKANFQIARVCGNCRWWTGVSWGRCGRLTYQHEKHTDEMRVGTPSSGTCDQHEIDMAVVTAASGEDYAARYAPEDE